MPAGALALLRFHAAAGSRVAMRLLLPAVVGLAGAAMLLGTGFVTSLARALFGPGSLGGAWAGAAAGCLGAAALAVPRVTRGLQGWLRHLPVTSLAHRRAASLGVAVAQAPLVGLLVGLSWAAAEAPVARVEDAAAIVVTALAAALAALPVSRRPARVLALVAALVAGGGGWPALLAAALLLALADAAAGPLADRARGQESPRRGVGPLGLRIAWRAVGPLRVAGACGLAALPLLAAWAFVRHNPLSVAHTALAARLGGGLGAVLLLAQLGEALAVRRPAWPWARSLPWSPRQRALGDAVLLGVPAAVPLVAAGWLSTAALAAVAALPLLACRAAGAVRRAPERTSGAAGEILLEGAFLAALLALLPWSVVLLLALAPLALRLAAERERAQKVTRWLELHHLAAGDPQSWSPG